MSEAINMHKRIAMGGESEANHLKKGGKAKIAKYAKGGKVDVHTQADKISPKGELRPWSHSPKSQITGPYPEKGIDKLPAKGETPRLTKPIIHSVATMKKGGKAKGGLSVMVAVAKPMRKAAGRGR